jgi:hypothetical protein
LRRDDHIARAGNRFGQRAVIRLIGRIGYCWRIPSPAISRASNKGIQASLLNEPPSV